MMHSPNNKPADIYLSYMYIPVEVHFMGRYMYKLRDNSCVEDYYYQ